MTEAPKGLAQQLTQVRRKEQSEAGADPSAQSGAAASSTKLLQSQL